MKKHNFIFVGECVVVIALLILVGILIKGIDEISSDENVKATLNKIKDEIEYFDELDYDIAKEQLYKGNMELALLFATIGSEELTRVAGKDIEVLSRIYDWCYDLLTTEQKNSIIKK